MFDQSQLRDLNRKELQEVIGTCKMLIDIAGKATAHSLTIGSRVTYISGKHGNRVFGVITKKKRTRAVVKDEVTGMLWDVPFSMLEPAPVADGEPKKNILHFAR